MADVHVRIRHLIVPASFAGDRQALAREVIHAVERKLQGGSADATRHAGAESTAIRIGDAVGEVVRTTRALSRSIR